MNLRKIVSIAAALALVKIALLVGAAMTARFVMDELALLQFVGHSGFWSYYREFDPIKSVLSYPLFELAFLARDTAAIGLAARVLGLAGALSSLALAHRCALRLGLDARLSLAAPLALLSFSNFMEHGFRVRTDTVALAFGLGALLLLLREGRSDGRQLLAGALLGVSFLCTQKAVYLAVAAGAGLVLAAWADSGARTALKRGGALVGGWGAALVVYAAIFGGARYFAVLEAVFTGPRYILAGSSAFGHLGEYVVQTLVRNLVPYALTAAALLLVLAAWRRASYAQRLAAVAALALVVLVFRHDQPWPYVFVWPQAFLAVASCGAIPHFATRRLEEAERLERAERSVQIVAALLVLVAISIPRNVRYLGHSNRELLAVAREAEANLEPGDRYFDGIGMVLTREIAGRYPDWWWDTPTIARLRRDAERGDRRVLSSLLADRPKLWILNYRLQAMAELLTGVVAPSYVRVNPTLLLAGAEVPAGSTRFELVTNWPGVYALFDSAGRPTGERVELDGAPPAASVELALGASSFGVEASSERRFLVPEGSTWSGTAPADGRVPDLFAGVYDF